MNDELRQEIAEIASKFKLFECKACALSIQEFLIQRGISGKKVKIYTGSAKGKYGNIYHDDLGQNIATNGRHEGIAVKIDGEELIFDNIHNEGISKQEWLEKFYCLALDLGGEFEIAEIEF
ncbi:papain fold toxin domain-containing protein [Microcoleus sp. bin38.metabat.b11b12b14.051]|uniref:papain fold toxin domain-containing protein n=1 Tax=Microcoleus sp. bin38.metabat.b11b12b14.051 TaxID=2742709 RepID=UPI0025DAF2EE|nr:papain fold toxin domain-containing protein [Microcoleus sp. bin38.metabat.b11b12b14.051]